MIRSIYRLATAAVMLAMMAAHYEARGAAAETMPLTSKDKGVAPIVVLGKSDPIIVNAVDVITTTVQAWSGVALKVEEVAAQAGSIPAESAIVLARIADYHAADPTPETTSTLLRRVTFVGDEGFAIVPQTAKGKPRLLVVGVTSKGVLNGAYYVRDFLIDGKKDGLKLKLEEAIRAPEMAARGTYALSIYGVTPQYTVQDWTPEFRSFARDGMNRVYLWVSGMFPSKKFPQTFDRDGSAGTKVRTVEDIKALIQKAHDQGLRFYLGSGTFAWSTVHYLSEGVDNALAVGAGGLNPSNAEVRRRHFEYFMEMIDALPEADGFFLEVRDEHGECQCPACQVKLDEYGSKSYGEACISFIQELAEKVWEKHPHVRFCVNVGYDEHKKDVNYYNQIGKMRDPRFEWLDCRWAWEFPGPQGEKLPASYFTNQAIHWGPFYSRSLSEMIEMTTKVSRTGYIGYCPAFEPGFATADFYSHEVPYPVDRLPDPLTGFAYRELTWEPAEGAKDLEQRVQKRFFGAEAPKGAAKDLMDLREMVVEAEGAPNTRGITKFSQDWINYSAVPVPYSTLAQEMEKIEKMATADSMAKADPARTAAAKTLQQNVKLLIKVKDEMMPKIDGIEKRVKEMKAEAGPKSTQTLEQMQRIIDDMRKYYGISVLEPAKLSDYADRLETLAK